MKIIKLTLLLFLFCICKWSFAACSNSGGYFTQNISFGSVYVQRDTPVGAVITSKNTATSSTHFGCDEAWTFRWELSQFTTPSVYSGVYKTNIDGVGIKMIYSSGSAFPVDQPVAAGTYATTVVPSTVQLIKLSQGSVSGGDLSSGTVAKASIANQMYVGEMQISDAKIIPVACTLKMPSLNFPIGDILASQFGTTVGTIPAGGQNTQNLGLDCDAEANINVSLSGTQNPDVTTDSVLALTGQGNSDVAKGVGVQLLYNNTPLKLNNNIVLKKSTGGQETFPIVARYYQTKTSVTTGKANASATLNLTYQ